MCSVHADFGSAVREASRTSARQVARTSSRSAPRGSVASVPSSRSAGPELQQTTSAPRSTSTTDCAAVKSGSCEAGHSPICPRRSRKARIARGRTQPLAAEAANPFRPPSHVNRAEVDPEEPRLSAPAQVLGKDAGGFLGWAPLVPGHGLGDTDRVRTRAPAGTPRLFRARDEAATEGGSKMSAGGVVIRPLAPHSSGPLARPEISVPVLGRRLRQELVGPPWSVLRCCHVPRTWQKPVVFRAEFLQRGHLPKLEFLGVEHRPDAGDPVGGDLERVHRQDFTI
jgi:hypothetical protein